jgi:hypothetical protein
MSYYLGGENQEIINAFEEYFADVPNVLYSFPSDREFRSIAIFCSNSGDEKLLRRVVECTGRDRISPVTRARILLHFVHTQANTLKTSPVLEYWKKVIFEGPEPDFMVLDERYHRDAPPQVIIRLLCFKYMM